MHFDQKPLCNDDANNDTGRPVTKKYRCVRHPTQALIMNEKKNTSCKYIYKHDFCKYRGCIHTNKYFLFVCLWFNAAFNTVLGHITAVS